MNIEAVCVYCGSSEGARPSYRAAAQELGQALAARRITLIYGGTEVGLMGAVADAAIAAGGRAIGVITEALSAAGIGHQGLGALEVVADMHARKARMQELADGFVALPGGFGTWEELFEVVTWAQLGLHPKPTVALDIDGFYAPLRTMVAHAVAEGFVRSEHGALLRIVRTVDEAFAALSEPLPPPTPKWADGRPVRGP